MEITPEIKDACKDAQFKTSAILRDAVRSLLAALRKTEHQLLMVQQNAISPMTHSPFQCFVCQRSDDDWLKKVADKELEAKDD